MLAMKQLVRSGRSYDFYSKMDDDSFIAAKPFFDLMIAPRLNGTLDAERRIIGRLRRAKAGKDNDEETSYPQGGFYTISWDLVLALVDAHSRFPLTDLDEDVLIGRLLELDNVRWNLTKLPEPVSFEWDSKDTRDNTCWAKEGSNQRAWSHALGERAMHVHSLKTEEDFWKVALCFDREGIIREPPKTYGLEEDWHEWNEEY